jgi:exosortase
LPTALWPVAGRPVLQRLLVHLADQGIRHAFVCCNGEGSLLAESICADDRLELEFLDELLPVGTAGCVRNAARDETDTLFLVFPASAMCPPEIDVLMSAHRDGQSDLTVMLNPSDEDSRHTGQASGIYVCSAGLLDHIPKAGYFDIKEGLIPELLRVGKTVHAASLPHHAGNFRDRQGYLYALANYLEGAPKLNADLKPRESTGSQNVWIAANAKVDPEAEICGPAVIMDDATVSSGAVVLGPTVVAKNATVGKDSAVINSVLWDGAQVGPNCRIRRCVVDRHTAVRGNAVAEEKSISFKPKGRFWLVALIVGLLPLLILERPVRRALEAVRNNSSRLQRALQPQLSKISEKLPDWAWCDRKSILTFLASCSVLAAFLWCYRSGLADLLYLWKGSDEHSSGLLVPLLAVYILWSWRHDIARWPIKRSIWGLFWGWHAFMGAQAVRLFGLFFMYSSAERLSIVLTIAALVLLLFGCQVFRKVSPILLFLCLMLPWPNVIQHYAVLYLQRWATSSAVFCLEVIGYGVTQEGNVIRIGDVSVALLEACNGLRMITAFFVISGLVVLLVKRAWWEKLIILVSSLPIALVCNTVRLTITAVFFTVLEGEHWEKIFHDFGGYAMMPLALAAVVAELWLLAKLTALPGKEEAIIVTRQRG